MQNRACLIIAAAPEENTEYLKDIISEYTPYVICADGGTKYANKYGIIPDLVVGDFDSGKEPTDVKEIVRLKPEKDDCDIKSSIKEAQKRGFKQLILACASGGRLDHFFGNISMLEYAFDHDMHCVFYDNVNKIFIHKGGRQTYHTDNRYQYISIVPLDSTLENVTLEGLKYPLNKQMLYRNDIISISNEAVEDKYTIDIEKGRALIILAKGEE